jgi:ribosomal-protein-alanine N-acetyltransferase
MPNSRSRDEGRVRFGAMRLTDVDAVARIEAASFPSPWTREHFRHELQHNPFSVNRVIRRGITVIGYASVWIVDNELQINKIAIDTALRKKGLGRLLMKRLLELAASSRCRRISLEVRPGNTAARELYSSLGFVEVGRRTDYYGSGEDAILMCLDRPSG